MFNAHLKDDRSVQYTISDETDVERLLHRVKVDSLNIYQAESGIMLLVDDSEEGIFIPSETLPLIAEVITNLKKWL